ncbi:hypothetical protein [Alloalcanivorax profundimaris]|uniref:hypothetical protein n=1 Tax=Alloalcanivorax profundimaris TaxID=2735259 RepID=UPI001887E8B6|nr:hypothetical protein [Alloalcanivorax profundimaris]MBF1803496.1 hypothetical protein [Alloalcanivorax profundimaris]
MSKRAMVVTAFLAALWSCSSIDNELKSFMKCGLAASKLEKYVAQKVISDKLKKYIENEEVDGAARNAMRLGQEVRDDLALYEKSLQGQFYKLVKVYNSSECRSIHNQNKISMPFSYYVKYLFL